MRPARLVPALVLASALAACSVSSAVEAQVEPERAATQQEPAPELSMTLDFNTPESVAPWRAVNDGVMGGRSSGGPSFAPDAEQGGALVFAGTINTNGGGFSSIRAPLTPGQFANADGIRLKVLSDGRAYKLAFRTSQSWRGRSVSWQIPIEGGTPGQWSDVFAPFADAEASVYGRSVNAGTFDPHDVREIGIIIADGVDGDFRLDVAEMGAG